MKTRRYLTWFGLAALGAILCVGFIEVIEKRFAEGGVYPHYASFRNDPLGTSAFYEALEALPELEVSRNIKHLNSLSDLSEDSALFLLGLPRENLDDLRSPPDGSPVLEAVRKGARLVVTINPGLVPEKFQPTRTEEEDNWLERRRKLREERIRSGRKEAGDNSPKGQNESEEELDFEESFEQAMDRALGERLTKLYGFDLESLEEFERPEAGWELRPGKRAEVKALPDWYSQFRFRTSKKGWKTIARAEGGPVVIERKIGKGSLVFASDSFFVSNEALHLEPVAPFLSWLVGGKKQVIFDETIHGLQESGGAMKLMRRYRIHGVFFGLFFFLALWAWRTSSPLAPSEEDVGRGLTATGEAVSGAESSEGLTRLLRRSIEPKRLLSECLRLWSESQSREIPKGTRKQIDEVLDQYQSKRKDFDAVRSYEEIADYLRRR